MIQINGTDSFNSAIIWTAWGCICHKVMVEKHKRLHSFKKQCKLFLFGAKFEASFWYLLWFRKMKIKVLYIIEPLIFFKFLWFTMFQKYFRWIPFLLFRDYSLDLRSVSLLLVYSCNFWEIRRKSSISSHGGQLLVLERIGALAVPELSSSSHSWK